MPFKNNKWPLKMPFKNKRTGQIGTQSYLFLLCSHVCTACDVHVHVHVQYNVYVNVHVHVQCPCTCTCTCTWTLYMNNYTSIVSYSSTLWMTYLANENKIARVCEQCRDQSKPFPEPASWILMKKCDIWPRLVTGKKRRARAAHTCYVLHVAWLLLLLLLLHVHPPLCMSCESRTLFRPWNFSNPFPFALLKGSSWYF